MRLTDAQLDVCGGLDCCIGLIHGGRRIPILRMIGYLARCFPRDLFRAHDEITARIKCANDTEMDRRVEAFSAELEKFSFTDSALGLMIRPCWRLTELIEEGRVLEHCVAGYALDVSLRKTSIFFIRRMDEPETPFYTLEWKGERIAQDRGRNNALKTDKIEAFVKKWIFHVRKMKEKSIKLEISG